MRILSSWNLGWVCALILVSSTAFAEEPEGKKDHVFFEKNIRPILVKHCYECHSEKAKEQQGGLLLDRESGWLKGGDTDKAVVPGNLEASLLITAIRYSDEGLQMPPEQKLPMEKIKLLEKWVEMGAPGPKKDLEESAFSRLGDQDYLFGKAKTHWAFQPVKVTAPPAADDAAWNQNPIDRFVFAELAKHDLSPSPKANPRTLARRLSYDLTGLPPSLQDRNGSQSAEELVNRLLDSPAFGEHLARLWLDVARYADTDSFYRPDTRTPHYFPFAFPYRDYVIDAFNADKPFNQFLKEQLAADLMQDQSHPPRLAALGFLAAGPYANRNPTEALDDWIDATTRGMMGMTAACARCHDHKYEPIYTADYYALRGVFNSVIRINPLDEENLPLLSGYQASAEDRVDYEKKRQAIDAKIQKAGDSKSSGNNRSVAEKIRETELAELLLFHPGAPVHAMIVKDRPRPVEPVVFLRGDPRRPGEKVSRRFLTVLDPSQKPFPQKSSGRLQLAENIVDPQNPLTARVFVNRVWGMLMGSHLVETPSDFGLQGAVPTHPQLLDWLAHDFVSQGWSVKHLVKTIVLSQTYQQASGHREAMAALDPENQWLWRANRKHLSIEAIRDGMLSVSGQLDSRMHGRAAPLWGKNYTRRRSVYGYINRFNLDPTLRVFDFPTPMQSQPARKESIVAPQALFTLNSRFVIDQAHAVVNSKRFADCQTLDEKTEALFQMIYQRNPSPPEKNRITLFAARQQRFLERSKNPSGPNPTWPLVAQALMMSNEFQYLD